jgi:hypothetical protein
MANDAGDLASAAFGNAGRSRDGRHLGSSRTTVRMILVLLAGSDSPHD